MRLTRHKVAEVRKFDTCDLGFAVNGWEKKEESSEVIFSALQDQANQALLDFATSVPF